MRLFFVAVLCITITACTLSVPDQVDQSVKSDSIIRQTNDYLNAGETRKAVRYLDSAYHHFNDAGPLDKWTKYNFLKNYYLNYEVLPDKAGMYVDSMFLVIADIERQNPAAQGTNIFARGDVFRAQNRFQEAFRQYFKGREYARKNLDSCDFSVFTNRLGLIRYEQGDFLNAITYFKQALQETNACSSQQGFETLFAMPQSIYNSIAFSYEQAGRADSAVYFYKAGIDFINKNLKKYPDRMLYMESALGVFYGNLGGQYALLGQYREAEHFLKSSVAINDRKGYAIEDASTAKYKLASMFVKLSQLQEAKQYLDQLDADLARQDPNTPHHAAMQMKLDKVKAQYYSAKDDHKQAFVYLSRFEELRNKAVLAERRLGSSDAEAAFREAEKSFKLEIAEREAKAKGYYISGLLLITLLILLILGVMWWHLKRSRRHNVELSRLNKKVLEQNENLRQTAIVLEQSQEENAKLIKLVAHDLRNPIGAVHVSASMLLHQKKLDKQDETLVQIIKKTATDCLALVDDLLRPKEAGEMPAKKPEDLLDILKFCVGQLQYKATEKQQHIELTGTAVTKEVNVAQIWRVFANLIGNAMKFSPLGATIWVNISTVDGLTRIAVKDHGIGIPEQLQKQLFQETEEIKRKGTSGEETHGLGLVIAKQIVEQHGGKLWFESAAGTTTFYVDLP